MLQVLFIYNQTFIFLKINTQLPKSFLWSGRSQKVCIFFSPYSVQICWARSFIFVFYGTLLIFLPLILPKLLLRAVKTSGVCSTVWHEIVWFNLLPKRIIHNYIFGNPTLTKLSESCSVQWARQKCQSKWTHYTARVQCGGMPLFRDAEWFVYSRWGIVHKISTIYCAMICFDSCAFGLHNKSNFYFDSTIFINVFIRRII